MTKEKHKERHLELHKNLDELIADYIMHNDKMLTETTVFELMQWSYTQTVDPTPAPYTEHDEEENLNKQE